MYTDRGVHLNYNPARWNIYKRGMKDIYSVSIFHAAIDILIIMVILFVRPRKLLFKWEVSSTIKKSFHEKQIAVSKKN
jgi:hypothetical protein